MKVIPAHLAQCAYAIGIRTSQATYSPDVVVLAAGIHTPQLAAKAGVGVPLEDKPGTVNILTKPLPPLLRHIIVTGARSQLSFLLIFCTRPNGA